MTSPEKTMTLRNKQCSLCRKEVCWDDTEPVVCNDCDLTRLREEHAAQRERIEELSKYAMCSRHGTDQYSHGGAALCQVCVNAITAERDSANAKAERLRASLLAVSPTLPCVCGEARQTLAGWRAQGVFDDLPSGGETHHNLLSPCTVEGAEEGKGAGSGASEDSKSLQPSSSLGGSASRKPEGK
jgi:hypothetical protein